MPARRKHPATSTSPTTNPPDKPGTKKPGTGTNASKAAGESPRTRGMQEIVFRRHERTPRSIENAADLWLEFFSTYHEEAVRAMLNEGTFRDAGEAGEWAVTQADIALNAYETRWPQVEP